MVFLDSGEPYAVIRSVRRLIPQDQHDFVFYIDCKAANRLPVQVLSCLFRRLFLTYLEVFDAGKLKFFSSLEASEIGRVSSRISIPCVVGIPTVADRLLQRAVARILEAVIEADFLDCS